LRYDTRTWKKILAPLSDKCLIRDNELEKYWDSSRMKCELLLTELMIFQHTRVGTLIVATIYLQLIQNRYMFLVLLSFNVVTSIVYNPFPAMWKS